MIKDKYISSYSNQTQMIRPSMMDAMDDCDKTEIRVEESNY